MKWKIVSSVFSVLICVFGFSVIVLAQNIPMNNVWLIQNNNAGVYLRNDNIDVLIGAENTTTPYALEAHDDIWANDSVRANQFCVNTTTPGCITSWGSVANLSTLGQLSDVTTTSPVTTGGILYWAGSNWTDATGFTTDGTSASTTGSLHVGEDLSVDGDTTIVDIIMVNIQNNGNNTTTGYSSVGADDGNFNFTAGDSNVANNLYTGGSSTTTGTFYVGASNLVVNHAGEVGIGTANPAYMLHTQGTESIPGGAYVRTATENLDATGGAEMIAKNDAGQVTSFGIFGSGFVGTGLASNAYVYTDPSVDWLWRVGGSERARITSDGNVGIATSTPGGFYGEILGVTGNSYFDGSATTSGILYVGNSPAGAIHSSGNLNVENNGIFGADITILGDNIEATTETDRFVWMANGSTYAPEAIDLGTDTTGNYTATIADAGNSTITVVNGVTEGGAVTLDAIDLNCTNCLNATEIEDIYLFNNADDITTFGLTIGSATTTDTLKVGGQAIIDGNVGIGTTAPAGSLSPNKTLEVEYDGDGFPTFRMERINGSAKTTNWWETLVNSAGGLSFRNGVTSSQPLVLGVDNYVRVGVSVSAGLSTLTVDSGADGVTSGDLGGITVTGQRNGVIYGAVLQHESGDGSATVVNTGSGIKFKGDDGSAFQNMGAVIVRSEGQTVASGDSPAYMSFHTTPDGTSAFTEKMRITSGGNIGISTTTPQHALDVDGFASFKQIHASLWSDTGFGFGNASSTTSDVDIFNDMNGFLEGETTGAPYITTDSYGMITIGTEGEGLYEVCMGASAQTNKTATIHAKLFVNNATTSQVSWERTFGAGSQVGVGRDCGFLRFDEGDTARVRVSSSAVNTVINFDHGKFTFEKTSK